MGTFRLYPAHCAIPKISEGDRIIAAAALLQALNGTEPESAMQRRHHIAILTKLTEILDKPIGRREPRVPPTHQPSASTDPTHPATLRKTKRVHQQKTRNNNPYATFLQEREKTKPQSNSIFITSEGEHNPQPNNVPITSKGENEPAAQPTPRPTPVPVTQDNYSTAWTTTISRI